jgi:hypothetical protein
MLRIATKQLGMVSPELNVPGTQKQLGMVSPELMSPELKQLGMVSPELLHVPGTPIRHDLTMATSRRRASP